MIHFLDVTYPPPPHPKHSRYAITWGIPKNKSTMSITTSFIWDGSMLEELRTIVKNEINFSLKACVDAMEPKTYGRDALTESLVGCHRPEYRRIANHLRDNFPFTSLSEYELKSTTSVVLGDPGGESSCKVTMDILPKVCRSP
jgi:hypothetical protein